MRVPKEFFGTTKEVRANCRKLITKLKKGQTLKEVLEDSTFIDINDHPDSLIVMEVSGLNSEVHFRPTEFTYSLTQDRRLRQEQRSEIKYANIEYLSSTEWGTVILNWTEGYFWFTMTPAVNGLYRKGFISILESTVKFWYEFMNLGDRFTSGINNFRFFNQIIPLSGCLLVYCGVDPRKEGKEDVPHTPLTPSFGNIKRLIIENEIIKKVNDDDYWNELITGKFKV